MQFGDFENRITRKIIKIKITVNEKSMKSNDNVIFDFSNKVLAAAEKRIIIIRFGFWSTTQKLILTPILPYL